MTLDEIVAAMRKRKIAGKSLKEHLIGTWTIGPCDWVNPDGRRRPLVIGSNPLAQLS
jgi:hypothetical protein